MFRIGMQRNSEDRMMLIAPIWMPWKSSQRFMSPAWMPCISWETLITPNWMPDILAVSFQRPTCNPTLSAWTAEL